MSDSSLPSPQDLVNHRSAHNSSRHVPDSVIDPQLRGAGNAAHGQEQEAGGTEEEWSDVVDQIVRHRLKRTTDHIRAEMNGRLV